MATNRVKHIPDGYGSVTPFVIVKDAAEFIDYMKRAFDAVELGRVGEDAPSVTRRSASVTRS